ncbi:xanthine dehydrogenase family protein molybdopterin-binding subunit [Pseudomonas seleniipraecipitans]|uniref:Xanthine dehydrogenase family protein molybdopterin-binding subunit n=1 Tax=Phytopseudomonas seleniipraecipitans TaxID=640205 RepID=A0ABY5JBN2_9GAMM|nr:xanthine dehydrogenase family protein molybdopterin-binding subunit [Pseudomonas seleniipraecipitans]UUD65400.1 xanthine dehydrogenase family protein molybdopterin-binding subunit [Pseudomonas seleniipraecipitans]
MNARTLGKPLDRVDGPLKVSGQARYAAEYPADGLLHGSVICSVIARGRIVRIDASAAEALEGVSLVLSHLNRPPLAQDDESYEDDDAADGSPFRPLFNERIRYSGQPVALVVADTLELARHAASLVRIEYQQQPHETDLRQALDRSHAAPAELPKPRGDADAAIAGAPLSLQLEYELPNEYHHPMEPHASTVMYQADGSLLVHDKTQGPQNSQQYLASVLKLDPSQVRVLSSFVGGAFGSGLRPQYQLPLAAMAALKLQRSVRVTLSRQQMFTFGYRPRAVQRLQLGAAADGKLQGLVHEVIGQTSRFEDFTEHVAEWSGMLYHCDHVRLAYRLVPLDVYTPLDMRAPGAATGLFALESAMDELAWAAGVDPLQLRLTNYAQTNQNEGKPYSSKELRACYQQGADAFGWSTRDPQPRSMRQGNQLVGYGMATGVWEAMQMPASARATLTADGRLIVASATCDIGPGTATAMTQIAAEALGLDPAQVIFKLGDSSLPKAPLQGGSFTVSSVGSAVQEACQALAAQLCDAARQLPDAPFTDGSALRFVDGRVQQGDDTRRAVELSTLLARHGSLEAEVQAQPSKQRERYASATHSAVFVEVQVDEQLGTVRVTRVVSAIAAGRVVNPKTARSQILGGVVWGVGMALHEEAMIDHGLGRCMNHNLADYHLPVHADIGDIEVIFVEEEDQIVNPLGSKGVGEIGIVGVAAAVANAVYHATGKRIRELPITLDKLL